MKKLLASTAIALSLIASPAIAKQWWLLDFGSGSCHVAALSPGEFNTRIRKSGQLAGVPDMEITRGDDGQVRFVTLKMTVAGDKESTTMIWASSFAACDFLRMSFVSAGVIGDKGELN